MVFICSLSFNTATSHFVAIENLELPPKARQFRRVNENFVNSLEVEMQKNPSGSYGSLFVLVKGISHKNQWKVEKKNSFQYEVLGGTHLSLATKQLHAKNPDNQHFSGRMCRVYVGLSDEQAIYLGAMHQQSSMFQHDISYREEVRHCLIHIFISYQMIFFCFQF